jgi:hypothetical protein
LDGPPPTTSDGPPPAHGVHLSRAPGRIAHPRLWPQLPLLHAGSTQWTSAVPHVPSSMDAEPTPDEIDDTDGTPSSPTTRRPARAAGPPRPVPGEARHSIPRRGTGRRDAQRRRARRRATPSHAPSRAPRAWRARARVSTPRAAVRTRPRWTPLPSPKAWWTPPSPLAPTAPPRPRPRARGAPGRRRAALVRTRHKQVSTTTQ